MRTSPGILFLTVWLVSACLVTGGVAAVTGMPSLWGSGVWFLEYALPVPWGWGLVHWPGLIVFGGLVKAASANPAKWRPALRDCALGTLGGLLFVCLLMPEAGGFPLLMYLAVDAVLGLAGSTILVMPADALLPSYRTRIMMLLGPAVLVLAVFLLWPLVGERYRVSMTDTVIRGRVETLQVWAVRQGGGVDQATQCEHLRALADQYRDRFNQRRSGLPMGGIVYLFKGKAALRRRSAWSAWMTYSWRPAGPYMCSTAR